MQQEHEILPEQLLSQIASRGLPYRVSGTCEAYQCPLIPLDMSASVLMVDTLLDCIMETHCISPRIEYMADCWTHIPFNRCGLAMRSRPMLPNHFTRTGVEPNHYILPRTSRLTTSQPEASKALLDRHYRFSLTQYGRSFNWALDMHSVGTTRILLDHIKQVASTI